MLGPDLAGRALRPLGKRPWPSRRRTGGAAGGSLRRSCSRAGSLYAQFHPGRYSGAFPCGLQCRHLPRRGQRQERLQTLAARLRSDLRSPRPHRRPRRAADQPRIARRQPDDLEADGRGAACGRKAVRSRFHSYERTLRAAGLPAGAKLDLSVARVTKLEIYPKNPVIETIGNGQQMRVVATYSDATTRDVTREAFIDSGNTEVATSDRQGVLTAIRRGEAPVLARYEGSYAATTLTVMGDRTGFVWQPPETWGRIDELVANKWQRMKIRPTGLCSDACKIPPPRLPRPDRSAPDGRRGSRVPGRWQRETRTKPRRRHRQADRQRRLHRALDEQMGRPPASQSQVPGARGSAGRVPGRGFAARWRPTRHMTSSSRRS